MKNFLPRSSRHMSVMSPLAIMGKWDVNLPSTSQICMQAVRNTNMRRQAGQDQHTGGLVSWLNYLGEEGDETTPNIVP